MTFSTNLADPNSIAEPSYAQAEKVLTQPVASASVFAHPGYVSGRWYGPLASVAPVAGVVAADTLYAQPTPVYFACQVSQIGITVGTQAVGNARVAIYNHDAANARPGTLLAEGTTTLDLNSVAANTPLNSPFSSALSLPAGFYWLCSVFSAATAAPYLMQSNAWQAGGVAFMAGSASAAGVARGGTSPTSRIFTTMLFADPFPTTFGAVSIGTGTPGVPVMGFRIA